MSSLERLAARCASEPSFLASALARYQRERNLTDEQLAADLGCDRDTLTRLRLCGLPRTWCFAEDCRLIAERFGVKVELIERVCWPW
jgi:hypothetical protein